MLNLILNSIIGLSLLIIVIVYFIINNKPDVTELDEKINPKYEPCKYVDEDGKINIKEECIMECEYQEPYVLTYNLYNEYEEGETLVELIQLNQEGEEEIIYHYIPNIVSEVEEVETTYTFPPCNRFCDTCSYLA